MNCQGQRTLYLKANGEIPCEDDAGEEIVLARIRPGQPFNLDAALNDWRFEHIETMMAREQVPWPLVCDRCAFLRRDEAINPLVRKKQIEKIQIETTLACALRCPCCSGLSQITERPGRHVLPLTSFRSLLQACRKGGYRAEWIEYCGQGEPLNHGQFPQFLDLAAEELPGTRQRVITNGNHLFDSKFPDRLPDELIVSCDGARQSSYEQYRINGKLDVVMRFMRRAVERAHSSSPPCRVVWKYILFRHNDSDDELKYAQERAEELGVDSILFVATHSFNASSSYSAGTLGSLPLITPRAQVNATPILSRTDIDAAHTGQAARTPFVHLVVDDCRSIRDGSMLHVRGWVVGHYGRTADRAKIFAGDTAIGELRVNCERPDVAATLAQWTVPAAGFEGVVAPGGRSSLRLKVYIGGQEIERELSISEAESSESVLPARRAVQSRSPPRQTVQEAELDFERSKAALAEAARRYAAAEAQLEHLRRKSSSRGRRKSNLP